MTSSFLLRPGCDADAAEFTRLIGEAWSEYPNCILDVDRENPELHALATHFAKARGMLWAAEHANKVVGMIGVRPLVSNEWEVCRVYVQREQRGTGLARSLLHIAERHASSGNAKRLVLWTDTRFHAAHAFYEKHGYSRSGAIRELNDISRSLEFQYSKSTQGLGG